ncbi:MAG: hypothetical protein CMA55_01320 [Euryarchaeota archaeon]|jgi:heme/copper-type cytochrome/quinol oxidase subunit 3|nr:hypothetical protein [Euryarchaeota archaeon]
MSGNLNPKNEHDSFQPILVALAVALLLAGLLAWPLLPLGLVIIVYGLWHWIGEEVELWSWSKTGGWRDGYYATIIVVITEALVFLVFFTFWFWARHYSADSWPPETVEFDIPFVGLTSLFLFLSAYTAHRSLSEPSDSMWLPATILLGALFLIGQGYEYFTLYEAGLTQESSFGTAFFALTGLHGLHVLVGIVVLSILFWLARTNSLHKETQLPESIVLYWHFVDAVWVFILLFVYLEVL